MIIFRIFIFCSHMLGMDDWLAALRYLAVNHSLPTLREDESHLRGLVCQLQRWDFLSADQKTVQILLEIGGHHGDARQ